jgi:Cys-tRNA(Pro)/Cys-tRNA(Cys) deacylase
VLEAAQVPYRLAPFDPALSHLGAGYGRAAAEALGVDPARVFKTLMVAVDGVLWCGIVPVGGELDLKAMARAADGKKAQMVPAADAERATGYVVGGISPLGQRRTHPTVVDSSALACQTVFVSAGARSLDVELAPADLIRLTQARTSAIGRRLDPLGSRNLCT